MVLHNTFRPDHNFRPCHYFCPGHSFRPGHDFRLGHNFRPDENVAWATFSRLGDNIKFVNVWATRVITICLATILLGQDGAGSGRPDALERKIGPVAQLLPIPGQNCQFGTLTKNLLVPQFSCKFENESFILTIKPGFKIS